MNINSLSHLCRTAMALMVSMLPILGSDAQEAKIGGLYYRAVSATEAELFNPNADSASATEAEYGGSANTFTPTIEVAQSVKINGHTYTVVGIGQNAFECRGDKYAFKDNPGDAGAGFFERPDDPDLMCIDPDGQKSVINKVVLPPTIRYIAGRAFLGNVALTKVNLPDALQSIGQQAFDQCHTLDGIKLPDGLTALGRRAFGCCYSLSGISIPDGLEEVAEAAFDGCCALTKATIGSGVTSIQRGAFAVCEALEELTLPPNLRSIGPLAFWGCANMKSVEIPNSVDSIGVRAFENCAALTGIRLPDMAYYAPFTSYGEEAHTTFGGCPIETVQGYSTARPNGVYSPYTLDGDCPYLKHFGSSFSVFAGRKATPLLEKWQKKGEYETTAQWRERVTEQGRQEKLESLLAECREEYVKEFAPRSATFSVGTYDADNGVFPVTVTGDTVIAVTYASVPQADAPTFKGQWGTAQVTPTYGVVDDKIGVVECSFVVGGKTFKSAKGYTKGEQGEALAISLPPLDFGTGGGASKPVNVDRSIDLNIPSTGYDNDRTFAVIIGNENYSRVAKVECAKNDAAVFAAYCRETLGLPQDNVRLYHDAGYVTMMSALQDVKRIADAYGGDLRVIFYYAGHGVPDELDRNAFLLPVDADGSQTDFCLSLGKLYDELAALNARSVVVFLDACFSGSRRGEGMLTSARSVALKVKETAPRGNTVVFSAATGDQTAYPYLEKGHGLFTFFLLQKIRDTKGVVTLGELGDYLKAQVNQHSAVVHRRSQTPTVTPAPGIADSWSDMSLR